MPPLFRRILMVTNPAAGRGRAARVVDEARAALARGDAEVTILPVDRANPAAFRDRLRVAMARADCVVLAGGDGTVHHALPLLAEARVPMYHLPLGTENLFARHYGMTRAAEQLVRAVREGRTVAYDVGAFGEAGEQERRRFAIMASIGPDAAVIRRLDAKRKGNITHLSYVGPIVAETLMASLPTLTVDIDGDRAVTAQRGFLLIANTPQYAQRMNPARDACPDDGLLDVLFFPARSGITAGLWMLQARLGMHLGRSSLVRRCGQEIRVTSHAAPAVHQLDGELGGTDGKEFIATVAPGAIRVLMPPAG